MPWALIRRVSLVPCAGAMLVISIGILFANTPSNSLLLTVIVSVLVLTYLIVPAVVMAAKVRAQRFSSGALTTAMGATFGLLSNIVISPGLVALLPNSSDLMHRGLGQGIGIGALALWVIGVLVAPLSGLGCVLVGWLLPSADEERASDQQPSGTAVPTSTTNCRSCGSPVTSKTVICPHCRRIVNDLVA